MHAPRLRAPLLALIFLLVLAVWTLGFIQKDSPGNGPVRQANIGLRLSNNFVCLSLLSIVLDIVQ